MNANCLIDLRDKVGTGSDVTFWTHGFHFGHRVIEGFPPAFMRITVNKNVWLGYNVTLLPGVEVGENSIVAARGVVAKSLASNKLCAGVPAREVRDIDFVPRSPLESVELIRLFVKTWVRELKYKGIEAEEVSPKYACKFAVKVKDAELELDQTVCVLPTERIDLEELPFDQVIFVSIQEQPSLRIDLKKGCTLFEIESENLTGTTNPLVEDLRDFLRRRTLPCGFDNCYYSISSKTISYLKRLA